MIGNLNHIAIVVADLDKAIAVYRDALGAKVSVPVDLPEHGVRVVFIELINAKIELLLPIGMDSPIAKFLEHNPDGGMHHICYEVEDLIDAKKKCISQGLRVLGSGEPKIGAHGKPVIFLHPKDLCGTLIELEQV
ncbi:MAG: methylmalonyl-CoA epimerase [Porticoccus sp.]|jgi:methylmalonyl-CoA/ethylmalonyl-CoA epimerase|uniref:methylmalonyl-CoA epimerase n=1 Tax=Porticoccus sp. Uisw_050_02 TaxID=3230978 RepID=UPI001E0B7759|nr:methylmalonyl-CoA epimerase [Porticoccus sp.]|tara:strand:+ start:857 stop:1261 length:405 start_codon:yes stop_codon:yes gene_type:complete